MEEARAIIAALLELNATGDRTIALFTPALVGMFGSTSQLDSFLMDVDGALVAGRLDEALKERSRNLVRTFIPQVAELNRIEDLGSVRVTAEELRALRADTPDTRKQAVTMILAGLMKVLRDLNNLI